MDLIAVKAVRFDPEQRTNMPHNDAHGPLPLIAFKEQLLKNRLILKLAKSHFGDEFDVNLASWKSGETHDDEFVAFLQDSLDQWTGGVESVEVIEGAAPDNDTFPITIYKFGPLFFIKAPEFDDIGYFDKLKAAQKEVESNFGDYIRELAERREEES